MMCVISEKFEEPVCDLPCFLLCVIETKSGDVEQYALLTCVRCLV